MATRAVGVLLAAALMAVLTACSSSSSGGVTTALPTTFTPAPPATPAACPVAKRPRFAWPAGVPKDLPQPPGSTRISVVVSPDKITIVKLASPLSLQQSVLFIIRAIQSAGYTLGRGDAEPGEADAPFGDQSLRGLYKMVVLGDCSTEWLVAVTHVQLTGQGPLIPRLTTASPSPLPFG